MAEDITQWEYKLTQVGAYNPTKKLNELGAQGWELCDAPMAEDGIACQVFKRPKPKTKPDHGYER